jgi:excisionase family DNA binding protein
MEPLAVDVPEAARLIGVSTRTIRRLTSSGQLQVARVGRRVLVLVPSIHQLLDSNPPTTKREPREHPI